MEHYQMMEPNADFEVVIELRTLPITTSYLFLPFYPLAKIKTINDDTMGQTKIMLNVFWPTLQST